jgi:hypothetical protein
MAYKIRPIVKAAFKCDALVYQFTEIDAADGLIKATDYDGIVAEVNDHYVDDAIIREADNRLDICQHNIDDLTSWDGTTAYPVDMAVWKKEARQLRTFLKRFKRKAVAT